VATYPQFVLADPQHTVEIRPPESRQLPITDDLRTSRIAVVPSVWIDQSVIESIPTLHDAVYFAVIVNLAPGVYGPAVKAVAARDDTGQYRMLGSCAARWNGVLDLAVRRLGRQRDITFLQDLAGSDTTLLKLATNLYLSPPPTPSGSG
jgi:hypothetical protein